MESKTLELALWAMASALAILLILTALGRGLGDPCSSEMTPALPPPVVCDHSTHSPCSVTAPESDPFLLFVPFGSQP